MLRRCLIVTGLIVALATAWTAGAQTKREGHPVLQRAIEQVNNIKTRLQRAPKDFGGHKQKAIDALSLAASELQQATQFDK